jgi:hypothetical protein
LIAYAQMFYTRFQTGCRADESLNAFMEGSLNNSPVCSVEESYRAVYKLARGENSLVLTEDDSENSIPSPSGVTMTVSFMVGWIVFCIMLLVSLVMATTTLDYEQIGKTSFWEPLLASMVSHTVFRDGAKTRNKSNPIPISSILFEGWESCMESLGFGRQRHRETDNWAKKISSKTCNPLELPILGTCLAIIVVPLWILLGTFTFGLLWPPQIRQLLFHKTVGSSSTLQSRAHNKNCVLLTKLRNDVHQIKLMSYERSEGVESELHEIRNILHTAINEE